MNLKCCIFLTKRYSKSTLNRVLPMSVQKDPVLTDCLIQIVRYVFYCFFTYILSRFYYSVYLVNSELFRDI